MLEQELRALQVEWPETPDIAGAVAPRRGGPAQAVVARPSPPVIGHRHDSDPTLAAPAAFAFAVKTPR